MSVNDRLFDELVKPITEDYWTTARVLAMTPCDTQHTVAWMVSKERMRTLEECGTRTAQAVEVAEPLWEDMRAMAGLDW
ncbi:hypothetical protein ACWKSP_26255 [Micromonosporaceae bacterium Da 78-11]